MYRVDEADEERLVLVVAEETPALDEERVPTTLPELALALDEDDERPTLERDEADERLEYPGREPAALRAL